MRMMKQNKRSFAAPFAVAQKLLLLLITSTTTLRALAHPIDATKLPKASIQGRIKFPNAATSGFDVMLNGGERTVLPSKKGAFSFNNVPVGSYILDVVHPEWSFPQLLVEITEKKSGNAADAEVTAYKYDSIYGKGKRINHPLVISYPSRLEVLRQYPPLNIWRFLKSPMVIVGIICLVMVQVLPLLEHSVTSDETQTSSEAGSTETADESPFVQKLNG